MEQFNFKPRQERKITNETHKTFRDLKDKLEKMAPGTITPEIKEEILDMKGSLGGSYKTSLEADQSVVYMNELQDELGRLEMSQEDWDKKQKKDRVRQVVSGAGDMVLAAGLATVGNVISGFRATHAAIETYEDGARKIKGEKPKPKFPESRF